MFANPIDYSQSLTVFSFAVQQSNSTLSTKSGVPGIPLTWILFINLEFCVVVRMLRDIVWQAREPAGDAVLAKNLRIYTHFNSLSLTPDT